MNLRVEDFGLRIQGAMLRVQVEGRVMQDLRKKDLKKGSAKTTGLRKGSIRGFMLVLAMEIPSESQAIFL